MDSATRNVARPEPAAPGAARIHVLFVMTSAGVGGAETWTVNLINGMNPARFRISLAYLKPEHDLAGKIDRTRVDAVFCCGVAGGFDRAAARRLGAWVRAEAVDVIVCTNLYPLLYGWGARWLSGRAVQVVEVFHSTHLGTTRERLQMLLYVPLLRFSRMLVYVCENQRRHWRARMLGAREDLVIHNGVDTARFANHYTAQQLAAFRAQHGLAPGGYVVGLCAYMRPEKAHGDLLGALAQVRAAGVDLKCLLVGDGPERAAIEARIDAMGLRAHVAVTGLVSDVRLALAACDVLAITSHSETFSIAALESMAMGRPIVMTDVGGASEQVAHGENGYLYPRGDVAALAGCLVLLADPARRERMGRRAREAVAGRFSLDVMVRAYERLFARLARSGHG